MSEFLFVYGTLRPELAPPRMQPIVRQLRRVGSGWLFGRLHDLGRFPAAVFDPSATTQVHGEVFQLPDTPDLLRTLDAYEEFDPARPADSLFVRRQHPVHLAEGRVVACWVYVYNRSLHGVPPIDDGDYLRWRGLR